MTASPSRTTSALVLALLGVALVVLASCQGTMPIKLRADEVDPSTLPPEVQAPYELFSERCSKCHSLARALNASIDTEAYWDIYVDRMRRMPGSGISVDDTHVILKFLYYYTASQRHGKGAALEPPPRVVRSGGVAIE